jgi:hypothetical protein
MSYSIKLYRSLILFGASIYLNEVRKIPKKGVRTLKTFGRFCGKCVYDINILKIAG